MVIAAGSTYRGTFILYNLLDVEQVSFLALTAVDLRQGLIGALADGVHEWLWWRLGEGWILVNYDQLWALA